MKKMLTLIVVALALATTAFAQSADEIVSRMEQEMNKHENDGVCMVTDVKMPVVGTLSTKTYTLGDKMRMETKAMGVEIVVWMDNENEWTYNSKTNEVEIKKADPRKKTEPEGDMEMFDGLKDGYDTSIAQETSKTWELLCKKSKSNKDKDAPKKITIVVSKSTFLPLSLSTKMSGITLTMRDFTFGVNERQVTFDAADYPSATIVDKR